MFLSYQCSLLSHRGCSTAVPGVASQIFEPSLTGFGVVDALVQLPVFAWAWQL